MRIVPLGDQALLASCEDESAAANLAAAARDHLLPGVTDIVLAYASVGVFFDRSLIRFVQAAEWLNQCRSRLPGGT